MVVTWWIAAFLVQCTMKNNIIQSVMSLKCIMQFTRVHYNNIPASRLDRALNSRSTGLGFDFHGQSCVEMSGKLCILYCLGLPSHNGYLVQTIVASCHRCPLPGEVKVG